jgi:cytochrome c biogenesis protein CcdA
VAEKILALLAAYALGLLSMFWLYPKAFAYVLQNSPSMRKKIRDALDTVEEEKP